MHYLWFGGNEVLRKSVPVSYSAASVVYSTEQVESVLNTFLVNVIKPMSTYRADGSDTASRRFG